MERLGRIIPTGDTTEVVQAYYDYLYSMYYADTIRNRATGIMWSSPFKIASWGTALVLVFLLLTVSLYYVHRGRDELYEATSFAGSVLERNGKVSLFTWSLMAALFVVAMYLGIRFIFLGFLY
jgi:hypothetical protein